MPMIDLRKAELENSSGLDYCKLRLGFSNLPRYAFRNLQDFQENRSSIGIATEVLIPRVIYSPDPRSTEGKLFSPIKLKDESGEVDVWVRQDAMHSESGTPLSSALSQLYPGELLVYANFRNGFPSSNLFGNGPEDNRLYLSGFWSPRIRRPEGGLSALVRKLGSLIPDFPSPLVPIPVRF